MPLVFSLAVAKPFNEWFVTTDVPPSSELDTFLEASFAQPEGEGDGVYSGLAHVVVDAWQVGSWTWNWMEPPLGTFSFVLLCMQAHLKSTSAVLGASFPSSWPILLRIPCSPDSLPPSSSSITSLPPP